MMNLISEVEPVKKSDEKPGVSPLDAAMFSLCDGRAAKSHMPIAKMQRVKEQEEQFMRARASALARGETIHSVGDMLGTASSSSRVRAIVGKRKARSDDAAADPTGQDQAQLRQEKRERRALRKAEKAARKEAKQKAKTEKKEKKEKEKTAKRSKSEKADR
jgi:hypothetical protein